MRYLLLWRNRKLFETTVEISVMVLEKIRGLEFDRSASVLLVTFHSGRRFQFTGVDRELFDALADLETRDRVFAQRIAENFPWIAHPAVDRNALNERGPASGSRL